MSRCIDKSDRFLTWAFDVTLLNWSQLNLKILIRSHSLSKNCVWSYD